jgi:hypothetical protein
MVYDDDDEAVKTLSFQSSPQRKQHERKAVLLIERVRESVVPALVVSFPVPIKVDSFESIPASYVGHFRILISRY